MHKVKKDVVFTLYFVNIYTNAFTVNFNQLVFTFPIRRFFYLLVFLIFCIFYSQTISYVSYLLNLKSDDKWAWSSQLNLLLIQVFPSWWIFPLQNFPCRYVGCCVSNVAWCHWLPSVICKSTFLCWYLMLKACSSEVVPSRSQYTHRERERSSARSCMH